MKDYQIFVINPGSTSTKIALFSGGSKIFDCNVTHSSIELETFKEVSDQYDYRKDAILQILAKHDINLEGIDAFVGRGGAFNSVESGVYELNETMLAHCINPPSGTHHPANLALPIANQLQQQFGGRVFMVNSGNIDEYDDVARMTGMKGVYRESGLHALNHKEVCIRHAALLGKPYEACSLISCHMGGGTTVAAHRQGRIVDGTNAGTGEGPIAPTRCGDMPVLPIINMCFSGKYTEKEMRQKCIKNGGFVDLIDTSDAREVIARMEHGDKDAKRVWEAMIYQIIKCIGSMAAVLSGKVEGILLTGGLSHSTILTDSIIKDCSFIAPVTVYAGEFELEAMASGAVRVLSGQEIPKRYTGIPVWNGFE